VVQEFLQVCTHLLLQCTEGLFVAGDQARNLLCPRLLQPPLPELKVGFHLLALLFLLCLHLLRLPLLHCIQLIDLVLNGFANLNHEKEKHNN